MNLSTDAFHSTSYPPIPEWLAKNPPESAMLLPNGDVVTSGLLGSGAATSKPGCCDGGSGVFARYDKMGSLVRAVNGQHWWWLYYEGAESDKPNGLMVSSLDGYIQFTSKDGM